MHVPVTQQISMVKINLSIECAITAFLSSNSSGDLYKCIQTFFLKPKIVQIIHVLLIENQSDLGRLTARTSTRTAVERVCKMGIVSSHQSRVHRLGSVGGRHHGMVIER
jgi:hypothetical protein